MFNYIAVLALILAVLALIISTVVWVKCVKNFPQLNVSEKLQDIETVKVANLSLADVVSFFKQPKILKELQSSQDLIAVGIKEKKVNGTTSVLLCIYNKGSSAVEQPLKRFEAEELSEDLNSIFGNKNMVVFQ